MKINENTAEAVTITSIQTASVHVKEENLSENKFKKSFP